MDPCDLMNEWDELSTGDKGGFLGEFINKKLKEWGFDPVRVEAGTTPGSFAWYNPKTGTITFDSAELEKGSALGMLAVAIHEGFHAVQDQTANLAGYSEQEIEEIRGDLEKWVKEATAAELHGVIDDCAAWEVFESIAISDLPTEGDEGAWA